MFNEMLEQTFHGDSGEFLMLLTSQMISAPQLSQPTRRERKKG
jgi:hypothetical protein